MVSKFIRGITFIDLVAIFSVMLVLLTVITACATISAPHGKMSCKHNLQQLCLALTAYANENDQQYPDASGLKFVALLYRTGYLTDSDCYICPAKKSMGLVDKWTNATYDKFQAMDPTTHIYRQTLQDWKYNYQFLPTEMSYAGRRNNHDNQNESQYWISATTSEPTPLVADHTCGRTDVDNNLKYAPHNGGINVLLTNGKIIEMQGVQTGIYTPGAEYDLTCLSNQG